jgi:hypothetical protein
MVETAAARLPRLFHSLSDGFRAEAIRDLELVSKLTSLAFWRAPKIGASLAGSRLP